MLTIATITPKQGEWYYKQENYYSKGAALSNSEWWGRGAATLGLSGHIGDDQSYKNVINGKSPDGTKSLREKPKSRKAGEKQPNERAGVDLTFSAPKSVSLACLVGGDKRLEEAHRTAVKRTLELIEKRYAQTRVKGKRVKTDNLTVAMWHHDTSRELDPHLHTHCVVMNATQLPNGFWQSRTDENLYYNKILLGRFYRNELAVECQKLGYEIESHPKELFEIKGYTREQIEGFSKRHEQILNKLAEIGAKATTENKVWAWRKTRAKKNHEIDRDEMLPYWIEEADLYGIVHPVPSQSPKIPSADEIGTELQKAVQAGIDHCSEREVAFKLEAIEKFIGALIRPFRLTEIERVVKENPELLQTFDGRFTTNSAVARELKTIRLMQQDFQNYRQTQHDLWKWHHAARELGKSQTYLHRITEVAFNFNASQPTPLSEKAAAAMQQDLKAYRRLQLNSLPPQHLWQKYSEGVTAKVDPFRVKELAQKALQDGCSVEVVTKMLLSDPYFLKIQQRLGPKKTQQLVKGAIQAAGRKDHIRQQQKLMLLSRQRGEDIELEL